MSGAQNRKHKAVNLYGAQVEAWERKRETVAQMMETEDPTDGELIQFALSTLAGIRETGGADWEQARDMAVRDIDAENPDLEDAVARISAAYIGTL